MAPRSVKRESGITRARRRICCITDSPGRRGGSRSARFTSHRVPSLFGCARSCATHAQQKHDHLSPCPLRRGWAPLVCTCDRCQGFGTIPYLHDRPDSVPARLRTRWVKTHESSTKATYLHNNVTTGAPSTWLCERAGLTLLLGSGSLSLLLREGIEHRMLHIVDVHADLLCRVPVPQRHSVVL